MHSIAALKIYGKFLLGRKFLGTTVASFADSVLFEIITLNIVPVNSDKLVPVPALMIVHHSEDIHQFVEDPSFPVA